MLTGISRGGFYPNEITAWSFKYYNAWDRDWKQRYSKPLFQGYWPKGYWRLNQGVLPHLPDSALKKPIIQDIQKMVFLPGLFKPE